MPDYTLPQTTPRFERLIHTLAADAGLWLVGGAVRDLLGGHAPHDLDFLSAQSVAHICHRAQRLGLRVVWRHVADRHGLVRLSDPRSRVCIDVKALGIGAIKSEAAAAQAALHADLRARDLTINAMAIAVHPGGLGRPIDPLGGATDLARHILRPFGALAAQLRADPLRLVRLARFMAWGPRWQLRDCPTSVLKSFAPKAARTAAERRCQELERGWMGPCPQRMLRALVRFDADSIVYAPYAPSQRATLRAARMLAALPLAQADLALRLATLWTGALTPRLDVQKIATMRRALAIQRWPKALIAQVQQLVTAVLPDHFDASQTELALQWLDVAQERQRDVMQLTQRLVGQGLLTQARYTAWEKRSRTLLGSGAVPSHESLGMDGRQLAHTLGMAPGPRLRPLMRHLLAYGWAHQCLHRRTQLLGEARRWMQLGPQI